MSRREVPSSAPVEPPVTVVYILGAGRSGSTLVERIVGALPGACTVGEAIDLFPRIALQDERCGCGEPFSSCVFWRAIGKREFDGWDPDVVRGVSNAQQSVVRQRHLWRLVSPARDRGAFGAALDTYLDAQARLYRAVLAESGASFVVDASKQVPPVFAMRPDPRFDLRVLHLVRDVRGVAHSWSKHVPRPHATSAADRVMATEPVWRATARWQRMELEAELVHLLGAKSVTLRYEDLVVDPAATVQAALVKLGFHPSTADLSHIHGTSVDLPVNHGLSGNPSRFTSGLVALRPDEAWRSAMSRGDRVTATTLGLPGLLRARYLTRAAAR